ncbi:DUF45 domain-containing protein [Heliobacterium gestii]|uniref:DUF45 domain-containing protein n=1 Tax=Heliomicrobium gestii TaxID=2699 RepID=A0A845LFY9_HELGE|nr:SprT family zinc-dependent metalloprotease [Heliomicrobium gestii]MBM7868140.1 putative metal-dependent hydrolase [Heliomicrobium gestii]MZP44334.1 DUF45 domain-containing protein [Heliomicrobium gestii]
MAGRVATRQGTHETVTVELTRGKGGKVLLGDLAVPLRVERRKGVRNISLRLSAQGLEVRGPVALTGDQIREIIGQKGNWILRHWRRLQLEKERLGQAARGDRVFFRGDSLDVVIVHDPGPLPAESRVKHAEGRLFVWLTPEQQGQWRPVIGEWLRGQAETLIPQRVNEIARPLGRPYEKVTIRDQKSRWGSCSSRRNLSFNWRLILFPPAVMDYVIVHELCHLQELNHSSRFWSLVAQHVPDYALHRRWLREHGREFAAPVEGEM